MKCLLEDSSNSIMRVIDTASEFLKQNPNSSNTPYLKGSISKFTQDLIMTFPTLCDNTLPPETASMVSKAHERHIVTMLQLLFNAVPIEGKSGADVLASVHKNINANPSMDDVIDGIDKLVSASEGTMTCMKQRDINIAERSLTESLRKPRNSFPITSFSEHSINDYEVRNTYRGSVVTERRKIPPSTPDAPRILDKEITAYSVKDIDKMTPAEIQEYNYRAQNILTCLKLDDAKNASDQRSILNQYNKDKAAELAFRVKYQESDRQIKLYYDKARHNREELYKQWKVEDRDIEKQRAEDIHQWAKNAEDRAATKYKIDLAKANRDIEQTQRMNQATKVDQINRQLMDTDIRKANEMTPTLMIITYNQLDTNGEIYDRQAFAAGVKSRLISVDSSDIIDRIIAKNKTKINFLNFIRATTGEIRFVRDFLLCVKQAKIDARNAAKRGEAANMWKTLENRSIKNNYNKIMKSGNDASSITTLIINQETVNLLKKEYDFDLEKLSNVRMVFNAYNLLGIIICDESIEVAKFMYAGNDSWEMQSYNALQKESNDNSYKKVINLLQQQSR